MITPHLTAHPRRWIRTLVQAIVLAIVVTLVGTQTAVAQVAPEPNPPFPDQCGIDVALVLDTSNSIIADNASNPTLMRDAAKLVASTLSGTPSSLGVYSFRTLATTELGQTDMSDPAVLPTVETAIDNINFNTAGVNDPNPGGTNWEAGFLEVPTGADVIIFATDGNPTTRNDDIVNDPGAIVDPEDIDAGVAAANGHKVNGTRIVGVGIGGAVTVANLQLISGPILDDDYYTTNFTAFEGVLEEVALRLCGSSVTVRKLVDGVATPGWEFVGQLANGTIIDSDPPGNITDENGVLNYKLDNPGSVQITEIVQPGYAFVGADCFTADGPYPFTDVLNGVSLNLGFDDVVTCEFNNTQIVPSIELVKEPSTPVAVVGETVTYTYTVTNTGDTDLTDLVLDDDVLGPITLGTTTLAPGESTTGTADYTVTAADLAGPLVNVATVTGNDPNGDPVTDDDDAVVDLAAIDLVKVADVTDAEVGDTITYTYTVTNIGSATLTDIVLDDDVLGPITLGTTTLAPGASTTGTATYVVVEADLPGPLVNVAVVTGTTPTDGTVTDDDTETVNLSGPVNYTLVKEADQEIALVGETITYTYTITNTGSVTLLDLTLVDDVLGPITLGTTTLAPGSFTTGTATYVVTEADLPGPLVNVATSTAVTALDPTPIVRDDTETVELAAIDLVKTSDFDDSDPNNFLSPGDTVTYTYVVTNTGSATLSNVTVVDDVVGAITLASTTLAPGESTTGTASYVVTIDDLGLLTNVAVATGITEDEDEVTDDDTVNVPVVQVLGPVTIGDTVFLDTNGNGVQNAGETGISGVTITCASSTLTVTEVTDAAGAYLCENLPPGDWTVTVDQTTVASDLTITTASSFAVTLADDETFLNADFGFRLVVTDTTLPITGQNSDSLGAIGFLMVALGLGAVALTRRPAPSAAGNGSGPGWTQTVSLGVSRRARTATGAVVALGGRSVALAHRVRGRVRRQPRPGRVSMLSLLLTIVGLMFVARED